MSVVEASRITQAPGRLLTAADVAVFPKDLPTGPARYELEDGRLLVMAPTGFPHGRAQSRIAQKLLDQGEDRGLGEVCSETGVILGRNPDSVVGPDVAFIARRSFPLRKSPEGYLETIPDLVVEVVSPNDTRREIAAKTQLYLSAGVRVVWIVDPDSRSLAIHRANAAPQMLSAAAPILIEDVIPGFRLTVGELFPTTDSANE